MAYAVMSSYNFASFPYDNACQLNDAVSEDYVGSFTGKTGEGEIVEFAVAADDITFKYCNQDMLRYKPWPAFPAIPSSQPENNEWMARGQEFSLIFGWTSVGVIIFVLLVYANGVRRSLQQQLFGGFESHSKINPRGFTELNDVYGYVPQYKIRGTMFATLLCDVSNISHDLIDWEDSSDPSKKSHNAIYDVPGLIKDKLEDAVLSIVKEWPSSK